MNDEMKILRDITSFISAKGIRMMFGPTSNDVIERAEVEVEFQLPSLLKECYLKIANGGFGPGLGVIGVSGGYLSDYGDIIGTYYQLRNDQIQTGNKWEDRLLPFCDWGCNTFSCVKCDDSLQIFTFEDSKAWPQEYDLNSFFEMWMDGTDILLNDPACELGVLEINNPFTGRKQVVKQRRRRK